MFDEAVREFNFQHGVGVEEEKQDKTNQDYLFKDPEEYKNMTPEQQKAETEKMKAYWTNQLG